MTEPTWPEVARAAALLPLPDRQARRATLLVASEPSFSSAHNQELGLPVGKPLSPLVREVAEAVIADGADGPVAVLAALQRFAGVLRTSGRADEVLDGVLQAVALARALDPLLQAWVLVRASTRFRSFRRADRARALADEAVAVADAAAPGASFYALGDVDWPERHEPDVVKRDLETRARRAVAEAARQQGRVDDWAAALDDAERHAWPLRHDRAELVLRTLASRALLQRRRTGRSDLAALEELAGSGPRTELQQQAASKLLQQRAYDASALGDKDEAIRLHSQRIDHEVARRYPELVGLPRDELVARFRDLPMEERRARLNPLANSANDLAALLLVVGDAEDREERSAQILLHLDLADAAWDGWATGGSPASRAKRVRAGDLDDDAKALALLAIARDSQAVSQQLGLLEYAARLAGAAAAGETLTAIDRVLPDAHDPSVRAQALVWRAWLTRPGTALQDDSSLTAAEEALRSATAQSVQDRATTARAAWIVGLWGIEREDDALAHRGLERAVRGYAAILGRAPSDRYRRHLAERWSGLLHDTADYAALHDDPVLADLVGDLVRHDRIAQQLVELAHDPSAPALDRRVAEAVAAAAAASPDEVLDDRDHEEGVTGTADDIDDDTRTRAIADTRAASADDLAEALQRVEEVLGPLGAAMHAMLEDLGRVQPAQLLDRAAGPSAVLQLLPSTHLGPRADGQRWLYRRLTLRDGDERYERADRVPLPEEVLAPMSSAQKHFAADLDVFPDRLQQLLEDADVDRPVRLHLVPTGLFHLYWDGLFVQDRPLVFVAVTSQHTSVTKAAFLADRERLPGAGSVGVFDDSLDTARIERDALDAAFPRLMPAQDRHGLAGAGATSVFAMALHGADDGGEGWYQAKRLPDGTLLTAGDALHGAYPPVCVLASCYSTIRTKPREEPSGFPVALFAKGASTVIGSVNELYDRATSQLMAHFYRCLAATGNPVEALRDARIAWFEEDWDRFDQRHLWVRLVAYGGAEF